MAFILVIAVTIYGDLQTKYEVFDSLTDCQVRAIEVEKQIELDNPEAAEIGVGCVIRRGEKS